MSTAVIVTGWTSTAEGTEATFAGLGGQASLSAPAFPSVHNLRLGKKTVNFRVP